MTSSAGENKRTKVSTKGAELAMTAALRKSLAEATNSVIDAPTALGKTHLVATTPWNEYEQITGGKPVVHLHHDRETRGQAAHLSEQAGVSSFEVKSGLETCPVAHGDFDDELRNVRGRTASKWMKYWVDHGGYTFDEAHRMLADEIGELSCESGEGCPGGNRSKVVSQFTDIRGDYNVIHATHRFAYSELLVEDANVIVDEQPFFNEVVERAQSDIIQESVNDLLDDFRGELGWVNLVDSVRTKDTDRLSEYREALESVRTENGKSRGRISHKKKREIATAILNGKPVIARRRIIGEANGTTVVLNRQGHLHQFHQPPDFSGARCVVGLDAYPSMHLWKMNTVENLELKPVLEEPQRQAWRRDERGLFVVRVGDAVRSYTTDWRSNSAKKDAKLIVSELHNHYEGEFRTAISSLKTEDDVRSMLAEVGIPNPETMHFGALKSKNSFKKETVGLVIGCIDPGDKRIVDLLAIRGLKALPEVDEEGDREYGRGFIGPDSDAAAEFLASVRENNLAQAVGRYARNPHQGNSGAIVYVWSSALPDGLTDMKVEGVKARVTPRKKQFAKFAQQQQTITKKMLVDEFGTSGSYALEVLNHLVDLGVFSKEKGSGDEGADEFTYKSGSIRPLVDLGF